MIRLTLEIGRSLYGAGYGILGNSGSTWSPTQWFTASEQGVWYDPSDFSTMFQDAAGTTPVTAVEQPVGLALDKRLGLVPGAELFATATTNNASVTYTGGVATFTGSATSHGIVRSGIATAGKWFKVTLRVVSLSGGTIRFYAGSGSIGIAAGAPGTYTCIVTPSGTTDATIIAIGASVNAVVDQIDVRELPGNHAYQSTAASRPVLSARVNYVTGSESIHTSFSLNASSCTSNAAVTPSGASTSKITPSTSNSGHGIYYAATLGAGAFTFSIDAKADGYPRLGLRVYDGAVYCIYVTVDLTTGVVIGAPVGAVTIVDLGGGWRRVSVTSVASTGNMGSVAGWVVESLPAGITVQQSFVGDGTSGALVSRADIRRLASNIPPYQRVNTATDYDTVGFPHYLKFDGVDDSLATGNIDFTATDKMTEVLGISVNSGTFGVIHELSASLASNAGTFGRFSGVVSSQHYPTTIRGSAAVTTYAGMASSTQPDLCVLSATHDISGDLVRARRNGVYGTDDSTDKGTGNLGNYPLYIGRRGGTSSPANMNLYQLIIRGAAAPLADIQSAEAFAAGKTGVIL